jgi:hypothetical protein
MTNHIAWNAILDMEGKRFGRLVVIAHAGKRHGRNDWVCECDCGNIRTAAGKYLRNGRSKCCGCLVRDTRAEKAEQTKLEKSKMLQARVVKRYAP